MVKINILLVSLFSIGCFTSCSSDSNANNNSELGYLVGDKRIIINDQVRMQKKLPIGLEGYYFDYNNEENTSAVVNRYAYAGEAQAENIILTSINELCSSMHMHDCNFVAKKEENNITTISYSVSSDLENITDQTNLLINNFFDKNISLESNNSSHISRTMMNISLDNEEKEYWLISLINEDANGSFYESSERSLYRSYENMLSGTDGGFIDSLEKGDPDTLSEELLVDKTWGSLYEGSQDAFTQCWSYDANGTGVMSRVVNTSKETIPFYWSLEGLELRLSFTNDENSTSRFSSEVYDVHSRYFYMKDQNQTWQQFETATCENHLQDLGQ